MAKFNFQITQQEYDFILDTRKTLLLKYEAQEVDCLYCRNQHLANNTMSDVKPKVEILNAYYSTRLKVDSMAAHIADLAKNKQLDKRIKSKDKSVIYDIAHVDPNSNRDDFSFATKYCALVAPDDYPIIDSLVWKFFSKLNRLGFFDKATKKKFANVNKNGSAAYSDYVDIYDEFIDKSGIRPFCKNYREVDSYIWGAIEMYLLVEKKSKHTSISPVKNWMATFAATLLANLMSTAIWHILSQINF